MWKNTIHNGKGILKVVDEEGIIQGFCYADESREFPNIAEIYVLYVLQERWGFGYGWKLFQNICSLLHQKGYSEIGLWVATKNGRARSFYERVGMKTDGTTKEETFGGRLISEIRYTRKLPLTTDF